MTRDPAFFLEHALRSIERIRVYSRDGKHKFLTHPMVQDAIVRNLEMIGQAIRDYGLGALATSYPGVEWRKSAAMRNVLAHENFGVDLHLVWKLVEKNLVSLESVLRQVVKEIRSRQ